MTTNHWANAAGYGIPGLIAGLILSWWVMGPGHTARAAQGPAPVSNPDGTIAFTASSNNSPFQMLYLIDTKSQALAVYRVDPTGGKGTGSIKLEAARQYKWDLRLNEFNNQSPEVSAVEGMVKAMAK